MSHRLAITSATIRSVIIALAAILMLPASRGCAQDAALIHPGPWPIRNWHNYQPRQDQLDALHKSDLTPNEAREVDRLYEQLMDPNWLAARASTHPCRHRNHRECRE